MQYSSREQAKHYTCVKNLESVAFLQGLYINSDYNAAALSDQLRGQVDLKVLISHDESDISVFITLEEIRLSHTKIQIPH